MPDIEDINRIFKSDINEYLATKEGESFKQLLDRYENEKGNTELLNKLGIIYAKNGIFILSEQYFKEILKNEPNNLKARNNLGNIYLVTGDYDKAISEYNHVLKINPDFKSAKHNLLKAKEAKSAR